MRRKEPIIALAFCLLATLTSSFAQQGKIGYVDVDYVLSKMPEMKQVQSDLQATNTQLQNQLKSKMTEYEQKLSDYQQSVSTMLDAVRQDKESELRNLQDRIQQFEQQAQLSLQKKQADLVKPVYDKLGDAIEAVAGENSFELILNSKLSGMDVVIFGSDRLDTSALVLRKLGISGSN